MRNNYFKTDQYLKNGLCLEISPLCNPILSPDNINSRYLDILSKDDLKIKYQHDPNVNKNAIVDVHYVHASGKSYKDIVGEDKFGLVLASHVIEHVPNLISWLNDIESVLIERGIVQLAIPDKRYCFDFRRRLTHISDIIESYLFKRDKPSPERVYDFFIYAHPECCNDPVFHHSGKSKSDFIIKKEYHDFAYSVAKKSLNEYIDVHCWVWTPELFKEQINFLYDNGFINLQLLDAETKTTEFNTFEFFVTFKKTNNKILH